MTPNHYMYISAKINGVFAWAWVITIRHFRVWNFHVWSPVKYNTLKSKLNNPKNGARRIIPLDLYWLERPSERLRNINVEARFTSDLLAKTSPIFASNIIYKNIRKRSRNIRELRWIHAVNAHTHAKPNLRIEKNPFGKLRRAQDKIFNFKTLNWTAIA